MYFFVNENGLVICYSVFLLQYNYVSFFIDLKLLLKLTNVFSSNVSFPKKTWIVFTKLLGILNFYLSINPNSVDKYDTYCPVPMMENKIGVNISVKQLLHRSFYFRVSN